MIGSLLSLRPPKRGLLHQVCCTNSNWLRDARVDAEEMNAARAAVVASPSQRVAASRRTSDLSRSVRIEQRGGPKTRAAPQQPMRLRHAERLRGRVRLDDRRAGWSGGRARRAGRPSRRHRPRTGSRRGRRAADRRRAGASDSGAPLGQRPTQRDASQIMCAASSAPFARTASRFMNCQNPATSCCSLR